MSLLCRLLLNVKLRRFSFYKYFMQNSNNLSIQLPINETFVKSAFKMLFYI